MDEPPMDEPPYKVGDLLIEERYPQGGCFIIVAIEKNRFNPKDKLQYKLAFDWGEAWVPPDFIERCIKLNGDP